MKPDKEYANQDTRQGIRDKNVVYRTQLRSTTYDYKYATRMSCMLPHSVILEIRMFPIALS